MPGLEALLERRRSRPPIIDTHCHIQTEEFDADRDEVLARAQEAGVDTLIVVGGAGDLSTNDQAVKLAEAHANLYATVGMHPHDAKDVSAAAMDRLRGLAGHPKVIAIGETGLDFYYEHSPRQVQRDMFERFVAWPWRPGCPSWCTTGSRTARWRRRFEAGAAEAWRG